jgi:solute carrier family 32 (vesicular inhibitory amino acid transporter)
MLSEDRICVALLFCATFGVGSMSFGMVFAAAGPLLASLAIYFLSACNLHASIAVSKCLTVAPISVRTFSDLGYYAFGEPGRRIVIASEAAVCYLTPVAFLILGGTSLLPHMFHGVFAMSSTEWIILMAITVLPIILIPTLKGAAPLCIVGGIVAVLTDVICIGYALSSLPNTPRETELETNHVISTFGTIMFAMGTAIIIPPIQRQHSDPTRLANLVSLTLLYITSIYMLIGIVTYYQFGCTAPATLLDELPPGVWKKAASMLMLLHIMIAFPVMLTPTLFDVERYVLGKDADVEVLHHTIAIRAAKLAAGKPILGNAPTVASLDDDGFLYGSSTSTSTAPSSASAVYFQAQSPTHASAPPTTQPSVLPSSSSNSNLSFMEEYAAVDVTFTTRDRLCSALIRTTTITSQAFLAAMLQNCFSDILSLIGATAVTLSCMIMPCLCYLKVYPIPTHLFIGRCDRVLCYIIIVTSTLLGVYCTVVAAVNIQHNMAKYQLFAPVNVSALATTGDGDMETLDQYPYCHVGERN